MGTSVTPNMGLIEPDANQTNRWQSYNSDQDILDAGYRLTVTAGAAISQFQALFLDSTGKAQLATSANRLDGIAAIGAALGGSLFMQVWGVVTNPTWTWTPGSAVYVSPSSAGALTQTPSAQPIGVALSATQLWIMPPPRLQFLTTGKTPAVYTGAGEPSATTLPVGTTFNLLDLYLDTQTLQAWVCTTSGTNSTAAWRKGWRVYTGSGAPSATTLAAGTYEIGDQYVDTGGSNFWVCKTAGTASTSVWFQVNAGGGASTVLDDQNALTVLNTTAETTLYTFTLPANTMAPKKMLRFNLDGEFVDDTGLAGLTITVKFYVGTLVAFTWTSPALSAGDRGLRATWEVWNNTATLNAANNFESFLTLLLGSTSARAGAGATTTIDASGSLFMGDNVDDTVDFTAAQTFKITVTPSAAGAIAGISRGHVSLEII